MRRDHHEQPFDEGTKLKLTLFEKYLEAWIPVFIHSKTTHHINIMDYFSGPGQDIHGTPGSPLRTVSTVAKYSESISERHLNIYALFNDKDTNKIAQLEKIMHGKCPPCMHNNFSSKEFGEAFNEFLPLLSENHPANLLFIDPTGLINQEIFEKITRLPKTDFLLFLPSEHIHRFKNTPEFLKIFPCLKHINSNNPRNVAHSFCTAMENALIKDREYHFAHFGIRKSTGSTHAVIFGSKSLLGLEKFLNQCWSFDKQNGEASFSLEGDLPATEFGQLSLPGIQPSSKLRKFEDHFKKAVSSRLIKTNKDAYIFSLKSACLPKHAKSILSELKQCGIIKNTPAMSYKEIFKKNNVVQLETV